MATRFGALRNQQRQHLVLKICRIRIAGHAGIASGVYGRPPGIKRDKRIMLTGGQRQGNYRGQQCKYKD